MWFQKQLQLNKGLAMKVVLSLFLLWDSSLKTAQCQSKSATISVLASVVQSISVSTSGGADGQGNLDFGITVVNRNVSINPNTNPGASLFTINGAAAHSFTVTYSHPVLLSDGQGNSLTFNPSVVGSSSSSSQGTAAPVSSGATLALNSAGAYYFWMGGSIYVPNGQQEGTYTGTFYLTATY